MRWIARGKIGIDGSGVRCVCAVCMGVLLVALSGCGGPRIDNTRLGSGDLVVMTDRMAGSFAESGVFVGRDDSSEPWVVSVQPVSNQTNDIIPDGEKRAYITRLRSLLMASGEMRDRGVVFVLPADHADALNVRQIEAGGVVMDRERPTHSLYSTFYAATTAGRGGRSDTYLCAFRLIDLRDDRVVWEDRYEVKRGVVRNKQD